MKETLNDVLLAGFTPVSESLPEQGDTVAVIMSNGVQTVGYYYDNWYRSGWMTNTGNGLFANQIWSGVSVVGWKK